MITQINNRLHRLTNKQGQHIAEFMVLFLAVCIAFVGTRLYLRRGINAKLKLVEDRVNEAIVPIGSAGTGGSAVSIKIWDAGGDPVGGCTGEFPVSEYYLNQLKSGSWFCIPCFVVQCRPDLSYYAYMGKVYYKGDLIYDGNFAFTPPRIADCQAQNSCRP